MMERLQYIFAHIKWKLTLSFLLVAMVSVMFNQLATTTSDSISNMTPANQRDDMVHTLENVSSQAAFYLKPPLDSQGLQAWLADTVQNDPSLSSALSTPLNSPFQFLGVVSLQSKLLAGYGMRVPPSNLLLPSLLPANASSVLSNALQGADDPGADTIIEANQTIFAAVPIMVSLRGVQGALVLQAKLTTVPDQFSHQPNFLTRVILQPFFQFLPFLLALFIPLFLFATSFTARLNRLAKAANAWSEGNFSVLVEDKSRDEVGQLTRDLNRMTQQLRNLIKVQQELAALEERNRLARELHDTIKQQVFALAFQINIVKKLYHPQEDQLASHIQEAQNILHEIQKEMSNLILTMRPGSLGNKGLTSLLEETLYKWGYQHGVFVKFFPDIQEQARTLSIPTTVKESFMRVMQGALSNVARHSSASNVEVALTITTAQITLKITDNGRGFEYNDKEECGTGISSMEERMKNISGALHIKSAVKKGTEVLATYKLKGNEFDISSVSTIDLVL
jgi:NarL family two-component system sensor histidine kinase LiaS